MKVYKGSITGPSGQRHSFKYPESDYEGMAFEEVETLVWENESMIFFEMYPHISEEEVTFNFELV